MRNKEEIKRIDGKYYLVRELEMDGEPVPHESGMLQCVKSIDDYDCQHCVLFDTAICGDPCPPYGFMVRVLPENSEEKDEENLSNVEKTGKNLETEKEETTMERKIGEIFEYNGEWYQCVLGCWCDDCAFSNDNCEEREKITLKNKLTKKEITGLCSYKLRDDSKSVIFKKLKKVGEPYAHNGAIVQKYRIRTTPVIMPNEPYMYFNAINNTIEIETKQTKEDMEEKKLNLKPFDIQKAREGKPVCTRDGRKARIVCFDRVTNFTNE